MIRGYSLSILEAGASEELAHDGGGRDFLVADGYEVVDELQEAVGFAVLRTVARHGGKDYLGMCAQDSELYVEG